MRLLNPNEYNNTVAALMGDTTHPGNNFPTPDSQSGYTNNGAQTMNDLLAEAMETAAEALTTSALTHIGDFVPCDATKVDPRTCAGQFVASFGKKAFRRPVTSTETTALLALYDVGATGGTFNEGIGVMMQEILQSPSFLYTTELGTSATPATAVTNLDPYELASAISYLVLASPPDDMLMAAADGGQLTTPAQIEAQARRLLTDARAKTQIQRFIFEWLGISDVSVATKDATMYPKFTPTLQQMMAAETGAYAQDVIFNGDASLNSLMTGQYTFVDKELGALYGVTAAQNGVLQKVTLPAGQRSGLLTQASVMTIYAHANETSPILRGVFLREKILCESLPPPPTGLKIVIPQPNPNAPNTTRALFDQHVSDAACSGCHGLIDPVGNLFEEFDAIGAFRSMENGSPIDSTGTVTGTKTINAAYANASSFLKSLGSSAEAQTCFARNVFRFGSAQSDPNTESNMLGVLMQNPQTSMLEILVAFAKSQLFTQRAAAQ
ncbi:MAG TPA: DUF1592 domain-containing protein [Polyangiaceae bacterium]|nr:DUF1592 domain-containing protein [Polyangiaceae bacterium]